MTKTSNELYQMGFDDGSMGNDPSPYHDDNQDYLSGYEDGLGDFEAGYRLTQEKGNVRPVDDQYYVLNDPPAGYGWAFVKRTPNPGDWYLSKAGNPNYAASVRGNNQKRHILILPGHEGHRTEPYSKSDVWCHSCGKHFNPARNAAAHSKEKIQL